MFQFFLALSLAFIFCECSLIRKDVVSKRNNSCGELMACSFSMVEVESKNAGALFELTNETEYVKLCQEFQTFKNCFDKKMSQCGDKGVLNSLKIQIAVGDIICNPEGKYAIFALSQSECATNDIKRLEAQQLMDECVSTFNNKIRDVYLKASSTSNTSKSLESFDYCPYLDQLNHCVVTEATKKCGQEFASLMSKIVQTVAYQSFQEVHCEF